MAKSLLIGLTGQTGAGKSLVSEYLVGLGYKVVDADAVSRQVVEKGMPCLAELEAAFGSEILTPDGALDRPKMGGIVFADEQKRALLGKIIYPYIGREMSAQVERYRGEGAAAIFLDAPTLLESGGDSRCDCVVSVIAPRDIRLERIMRRDGITREQALLRMGAQHEDEFYVSRSRYVIENGADTRALRERVDEVLRDILTKGKEADDT